MIEAIKFAYKYFNCYIFIILFLVILLNLASCLIPTEPLFESGLPNFMYASHENNQDIVIYSYTTGGKNKITQLKGSFPVSVKGRISPDGKNLALTNYDTLNLNNDVCYFLMVNLTDKSESDILELKMGEWINSFIWSSDSNKIYYILESDLESKGIWSYDINTKKHDLITSGKDFDVRIPATFLGNVVHDKIYLSLESEFILSFWVLYISDLNLVKLYSPIPGNAILPALSPDEKEIVYYTYGNGASFANTIQILDVITKEKRDILTLKSQESFLPYAPLWSPDGQRVLYGYSGSFWLINREGKENQKLIKINEPPMKPLSWSKNGKSIAVAAYQTGLVMGRELYNIGLIDYGQREYYEVLAGELEFIDWMR